MNRNEWLKQRNTPQKVLYDAIQHELAHARQALGEQGPEAFTREEVLKMIMLMQHYVSEIGKEHNLPEEVHVIGHGFWPEQSRLNRYKIENVRSLKDATSWIGKHGRRGKARRSRRDTAAQKQGSTRGGKLSRSTRRQCP